MEKINQWACYNRIWSWSPMLCEKHGPRAAVTTKTLAFGLGFCLLSPSGHVFHTTWESMIKSYNKQWPPFCENPVCHVALASKWKLPRWTLYSWYKCSLQVDTTIESDFVFLLCRKVAILVIWKANVNLSPRSSCNFGETRPCMHEVISVSCQQVKPRTWLGWFQHGIHRVLPCTTRDLTVLLHNY